MKIKTKTAQINQVSRKLSAGWTVEAMPPFDADSMSEDKKICKSIFEAIARSLYRKYNNWRKPSAHGLAAEAEIMAVLTKEIQEEIDKEILASLTQYENKNEHK
jgi:hypothetical protein